MIDFALLCNVEEFLTIMASICRFFIQIWMDYLLLFIIFTVNVVKFPAAVFVYRQCEDQTQL